MQLVSLLLSWIDVVDVVNRRKKKKKKKKFLLMSLSFLVDFDMWGEQLICFCEGDVFGV